MSSKAKVAKLLNDSNIFDTKKESDTIRLWENHRDQALLWRAMALLQIPATVICAALAVFLWQTRSITLEVPERPLPGQYLAQQIPDTEFMTYAGEFINLIASYQPAVARRQFSRAREMTFEPLLSRFTEKMMNIELKTIETTNRTQLYFMDPDRTKMVREGNEVIVTFYGERLKIISGQEQKPETTKFIVNLKTIPRNPLNPYGIVVTNVDYANVKPGEE